MKLLVRHLWGNTIEFKRIFSAGTVTQEPKIVIDGFNFPLLSNNGGFSILAKGLFGSGSDGVPYNKKILAFVIFFFRNDFITSTRDQHPIRTSRPTMACKMSE